MYMYIYICIYIYIYMYIYIYRLPDRRAVPAAGLNGEDLRKKSIEILAREIPHTGCRCVMTGSCCQTSLVQQMSEGAAGDVLSLCVYIYIYIHISLSLYIYIYREREREREIVY